MATKLVTLSHKELKKLIEKSVKAEIKKRQPTPEALSLERCKLLLNWYCEKPVYYNPQSLEERLRNIRQGLTSNQN